MAAFLATLGIWAILVYLAVIVVAIIIFLAPCFCWWHLKEIKKLEEMNAQRAAMQMYSFNKAHASILSSLAQISSLLNILVSQTSPTGEGESV